MNVDLFAEELVSEFSSIVVNGHDIVGSLCGAIMDSIIYLFPLLLFENDIEELGCGNF